MNTSPAILVALMFAVMLAWGLRARVHEVGTVLARIVFFTASGLNALGA